MGIVQLITMAAAGHATLGIEVLIYDILRYFIGTFIMGANNNHNLQLPGTKTWWSSIRT